MWKKIPNGVALIGVLAMVSACASPTTPSERADPAPVTPPTASIQKAINTVLSGVTASINGTRSGSKSQGRLTPAGVTAGPSFTQQCNASGTSCSVLFNESFNQPQNCPNGGSSNTSATLTGVIQGSATSLSGTLNLSARSTFSDCSEGGWVTNSNPSLATSGTLFITNQHTRINLTMSGGFVITNAPGTPNGRASCVTNGVLLQWDDITGNWANSGSIDCTPGGSFKFS